MIERIHIDQFLSLAKQYPLIDVRSPGEYKHAHIPCAHNLPLFTDEERKVIGTAYKQQSREVAIKLGLDFLGPKMKLMVEEAEGIIGNWQKAIGKSSDRNPMPIANCLLVYCWRGGMRSAAIAWLLDLYGFKVYTLAGGYKKFRKHVLNVFKEPYSFKILGGYTGSGKSELLNALKDKGETIIDLEEIAKHKGSAFGNIGMPPQPTQEMFENILAQELRSKSIGNVQLAMENPCSPLATRYSPIWLEDESQRIGHVNIPNDLWKAMRESPVYFLDIPFEERLKHITEEYGGLDKQRMIDAIGRIREKLGGLDAKTAIQHLEEGNTIESFRILLKYYDKFYLKALHNREGLNSLLHTIDCKSISTENANKLAPHFRHQYQTS